SLTLDPDTAHPRLALSEDLKRVRWGETRSAAPERPERFDSSRCVLGQQRFSSGRHYWEVRVVPGAAWALGVARQSVPRKGRLRVRPERGVWAVGQCGGRLQALASPSVAIALGEPPEVLGVLLDYEAGRVAFVEASGAAPLFAFPAASFGGEPVLP
ncbi:BT1A1 protein, partial [Copsychus sechellarum]|nr:BT1A1 protein [Copsychus sechellarum]